MQIVTQEFICHSCSTPYKDFVGVLTNILNHAGSQVILCKFCLGKMATVLLAHDKQMNECQKITDVTSLSTLKGYTDLKLPDGQVIRTETDEGLELTAGQVDIGKCYVTGPLTESFNDGSTRPSEDTD